MLRWSQSTIRTTLDGCSSGSTSTRSYIRVQSKAAIRNVAFAFLQMGGSGCQTPCLDRAASISVVNMIGLRYFISTNARISGSTPTSTAGGATLTTLRPSVNTALPQAKGITKKDPLSILSKFLSLSNLPPSQSDTLTANTLRSLYTLIKRRSQLRRLTSKQLTELLSLMGSLSLPTPRAPCIYLSGRVSRVAQSSFRTHWPFVMEIARDKEQLGHTLSGTDRYWIMRAHLANVVVADGEKLRSSDSRLHALSQANVHYLRIWRHSPDPEIHLPYFRTLLSLHSPNHISELVRRLCKVLELHANPHSRFLDILYQVLIKHGPVLQTELKAPLLDMVSTRLSKFSSDVSLQKESLPSTAQGSEEMPKTYKPTAVGIHELYSLMGVVIFPSYSLTVRPLPLAVRQWAVAQATNAFATLVPLEMRWSNLLLLAISKVPEMPLGEISPPASIYSETCIVNWRAVFILATLKHTLTAMSSSSGSLSQQGILNITRPLWRMWKATGAKDIDQSVIVVRTIAASFFRVSALVLDGPLTDACYWFCAAHRLFVIRDTDNDAEKLQIRDLMVAYILAKASCEGRRWSHIFSTLIRASPGLHWLHDVVVALIKHYIPQDADAALMLYLFGKQNDIRFSPEIVHSIGISLATPHKWETAASFLHHPQFSRKQVEELLGAILCVFQVECWEHIDSAMAEKLGQVMLDLYTDQRPLQRYKYPVRFFFAIMIASGHAAKAIDVIEVIHCQIPSFFTTRFFLRLMRTLIRFRQLHLVSRLLCLVTPVSTRSLDDLRRKATLALAGAGASTLARKVYRTGIHPKAWRTTRESLARAVHFRTQTPSFYHSLDVVPILKRNRWHVPTIKYTVNILVRARRSYAAFKLLLSVHHMLDPATKTSICNSIIHGRILQPDTHNGRLVRSVLRMKRLLESKFDFVSDRTTVNIILKAILRWRKMMDPPKLKRLFDHMVRIGYPVSSQWCKLYDVPFGTPLSSPSENFNLLKLPSPISFERHVRPMYKMFIKAFYVRHDVNAAKTVVGILKEEEGAALQRREARNRARRLGRVKELGKGKREVIMSSTSAS